MKSIRALLNWVSGTYKVYSRIWIACGTWWMNCYAVLTIAVMPMGISINIHKLRTCFGLIVTQLQIWLCYLLVSLSAIWAKLSVLETQQRQQTRMLQTLVAAMQSSGATDGLLELPDGIVLPAKSLQALLDIEKLLETGENLHRMVPAIYHYFIIDMWRVISFVLLY